MKDNIWFSICAFCVLTALLIVYYTKYNAPFRKYKVFLLMVWLSMISTVCSICNSLLPGIAPVFLIRASNVIYFLAHGSLLPVLLLYIYSLTDFGLRDWQRLMPWLLPSLFSTLLVFTGIFSDSIFWLDEVGRYHRGRMLPLIYLVAAYNYIGIVYNLLYYWHTIPPREAGTMVVFLSMTLCAVVTQLIFPQYQVENFVSAMCMMVSQLTVQNPEQILDGSSGMLNKQGFSSLVSPMFEMQHPFPLGFLIVDNYHELEKNYGITRMESRMKVLADYLKQHPGCVYSRVESGMFCFVPSNGQSDGAWSSLLQDLEEDVITKHLKGVGLRFQLKTGVVHCMHDVESFEGLLELLEATGRIPAGREQGFYRLSSSDIKRLRWRKQVDEAVRSAVHDGSLSLVYQPVYDVAKQRFCSAEALMRMNTKQLGFVSPGDFIKIAEENGAIVQLTQFVVDAVCQLISSADMKALNVRHIHMNLSAIDCDQEDLAPKILEAARKCGVAPEMLSVEVTETAFGSMPESILTNLSDLSRAGVSIMLDDYGTGYSNLARLYNMPLDVVKVDKSLVDDILVSEPARIVLANTIQMIKRLNKKVLVEGVETKEQAEFLAANGVDFIQGYYYARPMDAPHLEALFQEQLSRSK